MPGRRILITGIGSHFGTELARRLEAEESFDYVAGLDTRAPLRPLARTELLNADIRDPRITGLLKRSKVDTIVHNQIVRRPGRGLSPQAAHDINVIGSLQLLAACEHSTSLRAIVVRGSAGIYGAEPGAPQFLSEQMARLTPLRTRFQRDVAEIDDYFQTFSRRHPQVVCTMLRYQPSIGPGLDSQLTRYLSLAAAPTYLGFDPRLQVVHQSDALDALVAATKHPVAGAVNVAAGGTIGLMRMLRLARKPALPIPAPLFGASVGAGRRFRLVDLSPDFSRLLRYGRALDTTRLVEEVGFRPRYSTAGAIEDYLARRGERMPGQSAAPGAASHESRSRRGRQRDERARA